MSWSHGRGVFPHAEVERLEGCKHCTPTDEAFRSKTASHVATSLEQARASEPTRATRPAAPQRLGCMRMRSSIISASARAAFATSSCP